MLHRFARLAVLSFFALTAPAAETRVDCDTDFAFRLYRTLAEDRKHFVLSPFSVSAALGMASGGAAGRTLEELRAVRGGDMEDAKYHSAFAALRQSMQAVRYDDRVTLAMDNALFLQDGRDILPAFQTFLDTTYGCQSCFHAPAGTWRKSRRVWTPKSGRHGGNPPSSMSWNSIPRVRRIHHGRHTGRVRRQRKVSTTSAANRV